MDLHQQEVEMWLRESEGREEVCSNVEKLQPLNYTEFEVVEMVRASESSRIFKFRLGSSQVLGHKASILLSGISWRMVNQSPGNIPSCRELPPQGAFRY